MYYCWYLDIKCDSRKNFHFVIYSLKTLCYTPVYKIGMWKLFRKVLQVKCMIFLLQEEKQNVSTTGEIQTN